MEKHEEDLIRSLLERDSELKRYYQEHQELERKLERLQHKLHLTSDEDVEKKRIQKMKLAGKDRIMEILGRYR